MIFDYWKDLTGRISSRLKRVAKPLGQASLIGASIIGQFILLYNVAIRLTPISELQIVPAVIICVFACVIEIFFSLDYLDYKDRIKRMKEPKA